MTCGFLRTIMPTALRSYFGHSSRRTEGEEDAIPSRPGGTAQARHPADRRNEIVLRAYPRPSVRQGSRSEALPPQPFPQDELDAAIVASMISHTRDEAQRNAPRTPGSAPRTASPMPDPASLFSPSKQPRAHWENLDQNCAESTIAALARLYNRPVPEFGGASGAGGAADIQIEFANFVALLNDVRHNETNLEIPAPETDPSANGRACAAALAEYLNDRTRVSLHDVFIMRTGTRDGAGHFQTVFYDQTQACWRAFSSAENSFRLTAPQSSAPDGECIARLKGGSRSIVTLGKLHIGDMDAYARFIAECRRQRLPFVIPDGLLGG